MNEVAQATPSTARISVIPTALVRGKITARRRYTSRTGVVYLTIVRLPAPDEYTSPQSIELRSKNSLGEVEETVAVKVNVGGYSRTFQTTDEETGRKSSVQTADNTLTVVEA